MKSQKLFIKTYGCQANINDSEILANQFEKKGHRIVDSEDKADVIFINSCTVKNKTQSKILSYIQKYFNNKKIIIGGCLIKTNNLKKQFPKIKILNTINLKRLNQNLIRKDKNISIIQISQGCLNECAYCATRIAKGKLKSYPINKIKKEFEKAIDDNCKIIYLTSQDNGCWGFDIGTNLAELLEELISLKGRCVRGNHGLPSGDYKIRIGMINPWHMLKFLDKLIKIYESEKIIKFLHIPIQSGSNKVLKEMKRTGKVEDFILIAEKFRKAFPRTKYKDSTIATDIIVGYPTETEEDFDKTLELIKKVKPEVLNISAFSSRPKTQAKNLKPLPSEIIKSRSKKLNELYLSYRKSL